MLFAALTSVICLVVFLMSFLIRILIALLLQEHDIANQVVVVVEECPAVDEEEVCDLKLEALVGYLFTSLLLSFCSAFT